jgi:cell division protein ZapA
MLVLEELAMQKEKSKVAVEIMGHQYTMVGEEPEEYLHSIAVHVDKKMKELNKKSSIMNNAMLAVLTALNIADDYFKLKRELEIALKEANKPEKELEDARYRMRKAGEEIAGYKAEINNLKQQLSNSQEEASNIYEEWLKVQKETKDAKARIQMLEEQKKELEMQLSRAKGEQKRLKSELEDLKQRKQEKFRNRNV